MDGNFQKTQQEEEIFDEELKAMGIPFEDETKPREMPKLEDYEAGRVKQMDHPGRTCYEGEPCRKDPVKAMDASYTPFGKPKVSLRDRLIGCAKWTLICGGIAMLL